MFVYVKLTGLCSNQSYMSDFKYYTGSKPFGLGNCKQRKCCVGLAILFRHSYILRLFSNTNDEEGLS